MRKKTLYLFLICLLHVCAFGAKALTIDGAIFEGMNYVSEKAPPGTKVAVLNIESDNRDLSDYIIVECRNHIAGSTFLSLSNTGKLPSILREKGISDLNAVDDETFLEAAGLLGADFAVLGNFSKQTGNYRFLVRILSVETGKIIGMQSYEVHLDEILADFTGETYNPSSPPSPSSQNLDDIEKELEELRKQARESQLRADSAFAELEARKKGDDRSARERLEADFSAARDGWQVREDSSVKIEAPYKVEIPAKGGRKRMFVFSLRPELVSGLSAMGVGGTLELGSIYRKGFYFTTEVGGGAVYGGAGFNFGGCINKNGRVKNVLGITGGLWNTIIYVRVHGGAFWDPVSENIINTPGYSSYEDYNFSTGGIFWKIMFGNGRNNFDITNKLLFGYISVGYDNVNRLNITHSLSIGYTLTKDRRR